MLDTRETLRTFPNLGQPLFAASEQTRTNQKKAEWHTARRPERAAVLGVISWKIGEIQCPTTKARSVSQTEISTEQARKLIDRFGGNREKIYAAAETLKQELQA